jgi:hypothetical protein
MNKRIAGIGWFSHCDENTRRHRSQRPGMNGNHEKTLHYLRQTGSTDSGQARG